MPQNHDSFESFATSPSIAVLSIDRSLSILGFFIRYRNGYVDVLIKIDVVHRDGYSNSHYFPTAVVTVQKVREMNTNIPRHCISLIQHNL